MGVKRKNNTNRMYGPNCSVCQYMKKHADFRYAAMHSTYFDPNGPESLFNVNERYGNPFKPPTLYRHMSRHQKRDIDTAERLTAISGEPSKVWQRKTKQTDHKVLAKVEEEKQIDQTILENTVAVVEGVKLTSTQAHEIGLDEFIALGRDKLKHNEMSISAANYLSAIKIKAEIERTTKDRKLEMLKTMFTGAAPKQADQ